MSAVGAVAAVVAVLAFLFGIAAWIADHTEPEQDAEVVPLFPHLPREADRTHVALTDLPTTKGGGAA